MNVKQHSPMIEQFLQIKESHKDSLLFYRMGDFYEMFFEDAEIGSKALGITLTKRGKSEGESIPMCGVPAHSVDGYLARLIKAGHRVAICEQVEDPQDQRQRGGKGPLRREVTRILTPGTLTQDDLLPARAHNFLASLGRAGDGVAVAWADMSTGDFSVQEVEPRAVEGMVAMLNPAELVVPTGAEPPPAAEQLGVCVTWQAASLFDSKAGERALCAHYAVAGLDGFGQFSRAMLSAAGALLGYIDLTQKGNMPRLRPPVAVVESGYMEIDQATRRSLEITRTLSGEARGSLLESIDMTVSAAGGRLLGERIAAPLATRAGIVERLELVSWFAGLGEPAERLRAMMGGIADIERCISRLSMGHGGPRDLEALAAALDIAARFVDVAGQDERIGQPEGLAALYGLVAAPCGLALELGPALGEELPLLARDGGFVRAGFDGDLDELRRLRDESRRLIAGLQQQYSDSTKIASLKIKHNNVLGYHVEVRANHGERLMNDERFIHRQTTAQAQRFTTTDLAELARELSTAAERALAREVEIFETLRALVLDNAAALGEASRALAQIDVAMATAWLAVKRDFRRPEICDDTSFDVVQGRHPVIESMLGPGQSFMANDCSLGDERRVWLVTGPNMAGKSTFLRQNAHIAIMAQAGLFVPAQSARIGVIDRLFSRVGAADDLARGRSTFMVEMVETAAILNRASRRSFVILDEIGRGTATWDGLAIAWATLEHLHSQNRCRTLFATHYHELTQLRAELDALSCHSMKVREWQGEIIFLHQVDEGAADRSYGVHVARLAGLPDAVIARAHALLQQMESTGHGVVDATKLVETMPLFGNDGGRGGASDAPDGVGARLAEVTPDQLTPRDALELIYELCELHRKETG